MKACVAYRFGGENHAIRLASWHTVQYGSTTVVLLHIHWSMMIDPKCVREARNGLRKKVLAGSCQAGGC